VKGFLSAYPKKMNTINSSTFISSHSTITTTWHIRQNDEPMKWGLIFIGLLDHLSPVQPIKTGLIFVLV